MMLTLIRERAAVMRCSVRCLLADLGAMRYRTDATIPDMGSPAFVPLLFFAHRPLSMGI